MTANTARGASLCVKNATSYPPGPGAKRIEVRVEHGVIAEVGASVEPRGAPVVELHNAAPGGDRNNTRNAELDGFLHRQVHLFARLQGLHQGHRQRRFAFGGQPL